MKKFLFILFVLLNFNALAIPKDTLFERTIKLDLVPLFNMARGLNQAYFSFEYEQNNQKSIINNLRLSFGRMEHYTFLKYNNYFDNQLTYKETNLNSLGVQLAPYISYYPFRSRKYLKYFYSTATLNVNYYSRKFHTYDYTTGESTTTHQNIFQSGAGLGLGFKIKIYKKWGAELSSNLYYNFINDDFYKVSLTAFWHSTQLPVWADYQVKLYYKL
ncbi:MAG: hypothetical protein JXR60_11400 [Bacteroidales bacterium]|nr:hypothetical protein [Bacteroidales bacterium]